MQTKKANLMFIDNPVGTGYSYVDDLSSLPTTNAQIALDLVEVLKSVFTDYPEMQVMPFYIFAESYGGKMTVDTALALDAVSIDYFPSSLNNKKINLLLQMRSIIINYPFRTQAIQSGEVVCNFQGVGLGDSWISPMDSVNTWGSFLYNMVLYAKLHLVKTSGLIMFYF